MVSVKTVAFYVRCINTLSLLNMGKLRVKRKEKKIMIIILMKIAIAITFIVRITSDCASDL